MKWQFGRNTKVLLILALGVSACAADEPKDMTAVVAAWNIKAMPHPISKTRAARIATGIAYLDPEVILLTEVGTKEGDEPIIEEIVRKLNAYGSEYDHKMPSQKADLKIAIVFKKGVDVSGVGLIDGTDLGIPSYRKALKADIRIGTFDFVLIGVHLKSGRQKDSRIARTKQAALIAEFVENATKGAEKDVLIVGDYNMVPSRGGYLNDEENFAAMNPDEFLQFVSSEDLAGQGSHLSNGGNPGNLLDGYAISYDYTNEYIDGSLRIFPLFKALRLTAAEYVSRVSDHLPLVARFDIVVDDDD